MKHCPQCQHVSRGEFPAEVAQPVQYGVRVKALGVYLTEYQLGPYERTGELFDDVFEHPLSDGTLHTARAECYQKLEKTEETIKQELRQADVLHSDESGLYVRGKREWVHVTSTATLTHYAHHAQRGKAATDAIDILPKFHGTNMHDGYGSYPQYTQCQHALCNGHHLRELTFIEEQCQQAWARKMKDLLLAIKERVERAQVVEADALDPRRSVRLSGAIRRL